MRFVVLTLALCATLGAQEVSWEAELNASWVGGATTDLGSGRRGRVTAQSALARAVLSRPIFNGPLLRFGGELHRFSFGLPDAAPLPNTLQSATAIIGVDLEISGVLVRIEAKPGLYTTDLEDLEGGDFNVPVIIGGLYIVNKDLQLALGVSVDVNREYPVLPGGGIRWKFADRWLLNAILPRPRLEFEATDNLTLYAGGEVRAMTFRVDDDFGRANGDSRLNGACLDYTELRAGGGFRWQMGAAFTLEAEAGWLAYREFNYHRPGFDVTTESGAPYGQLILSAKF